MAATKRTNMQRENDMQRASELYLKGWRQVDIAAELKIAQSQVSYDLAVIQKRWRKQTALNLDEYKVRELERIDILERTYWAAWENSLGERVKMKAAKNALGGKAASVEKETLLGNPAYLAGVQACIELRCKMLGLYAPSRTEVTGKDGGAIQTESTHNLRDLSDVELMRLLAEATNDRDSAQESATWAQHYPTRKIMGGSIG